MAPYFLDIVYTLEISLKLCLKLSFFKKNFLFVKFLFVFVVFLVEMIISLALTLENRSSTFMHSKCLIKSFLLFVFLICRIFTIFPCRNCCGDLGNLEVLSKYLEGEEEKKEKGRDYLDKNLRNVSDT